MEQKFLPLVIATAIDVLKKFPSDIRNFFRFKNLSKVQIAGFFLFLLILVYLNQIIWRAISSNSDELLKNVEYFFYLFLLPLMWLFNFSFFPEIYVNISCTEICLKNKRIARILVLSSLAVIMIIYHWIGMFSYLLITILSPWFLIVPAYILENPRKIESTNQLRRIPSISRNAMVRIMLSSLIIIAAFQLIDFLLLIPVGLTAYFAVTNPELVTSSQLLLVKGISELFTSICFLLIYCRLSYSVFNRIST